MVPRYEARAEDDGSWTVYDRATDMPAVVNDVPQLGYSEEDARAVARELDELMGEGEDDLGTLCDMCREFFDTTKPSDNS